MNEETPEIPETVRLSTKCLLSKWGFVDGNQFDWILDHNDDYDPHATIIECVRKKMLPVLNQDVRIVKIVTRHNPCRAVNVGGVDVIDLWDDPFKSLDYPLLPEFVVMSGAEILEVAEAIRLNSENADVEARLRCAPPQQDGF